MAKTRQIQIFNQMQRYLRSIGFTNDDFEGIFAGPNVPLMQSYANILAYLCSIVGKNAQFWEETIGLSREEMAFEGLSWVYNN